MGMTATPAGTGPTAARCSSTAGQSGPPAVTSKAHALRSRPGHAGADVSPRFKQSSTNTPRATTTTPPELTKSQPAAPSYPPSPLDAALFAGTYVHQDATAADGSYCTPSDDPWNVWPRRSRRLPAVADNLNSGIDGGEPFADLLSLVLWHNKSHAADEPEKTEGAATVSAAHEKVAERLGQQLPLLQPAGMPAEDGAASRQLAAQNGVEQQLLLEAQIQDVNLPNILPPQHQTRPLTSSNSITLQQPAVNNVAARATKQPELRKAQDEKAQQQQQHQAQLPRSNSNATTTTTTVTRKSANFAGNQDVASWRNTSGSSRTAALGGHDSTGSSRQLTSRIARCKSITDLRKVLFHLTPDTRLQAVHLAAVLSRLRAFHLQDPGSVSRETTQLLVTHVISTWPACVSAAEPGPAAVILWAAAQMHLTLSKQVQAVMLTAVASASLAAATSQGKAKRSAAQQVPAGVARPARPQQQTSVDRELTPEGLSNVIWAAGKQCPDLLTQHLTQLSTMLCSCLPHWSNAQLTAAVWGLSRAYAPPSVRLSEALAEELWTRGPGFFSSRDLLTLVDAFTTWAQQQRQPGLQPTQARTTVAPYLKDDAGGSPATRSYSQQQQQHSENVTRAGLPVGLQETFMRMLWSKQLVWPNTRHAHSAASSAVWTLVACTSEGTAHTLHPKVISQVVRLVCAGVRNLGLWEVSAALRCMALLRPATDLPSSALVKQPGSQDRNSIGNSVAAEQAGSLPSSDMTTSAQAPANHAGRVQRKRKQTSVTRSELSRDHWVYATDQLLARLEELLPQQHTSEHHTANQLPQQHTSEQHIGGGAAQLVWSGKELALTLLGVQKLRLPLQPSLAFKMQAAIQQLAVQSGMLEMHDVSMILSVAASLKLSIDPATVCSLLLRCQLSTTHSHTRLAPTRSTAITAEPAQSLGSAVATSKLHQLQQQLAQMDVQTKQLLPEDQQVADACTHLVSAGYLLVAVVKWSVQPPARWFQDFTAQVQQDVQVVCAACQAQPQLSDEGLRAAACQLLWALPRVRAADSSRQTTSTPAIRPAGGSGQTASTPAADEGQRRGSPACLLWPQPTALALVKLALGPIAQPAGPHAGSMQQQASQSSMPRLAAPDAQWPHQMQPTTVNALHPAPLVMLVQGIANHSVQPTSLWAPQLWPQISSVTWLFNLGPVHAAEVLHAVSTAALPASEAQQVPTWHASAAARQFLSKRAVRSWPVATRKLLQQCQGVRQPAALLAGLLRLGLPPGPVWLGTLEAVVQEQLQQSLGQEHGRPEKTANSSSGQTGVDGVLPKVMGGHMAWPGAREYAPDPSIQQMSMGSGVGTCSVTARDVTYLARVLLWQRKEAEGHLFRQWGLARSQHRRQRPGQLPGMDGPVAANKAASSQPSAPQIASDVPPRGDGASHDAVQSAGHQLGSTQGQGEGGLRNGQVPVASVMVGSHPVLTTRPTMPQLKARPTRGIGASGHGSIGNAACRTGATHTTAEGSSNSWQSPDGQEPALEKYLSTVQGCRRIGKALLAYVDQVSHAPSHAFWQPTTAQQHVAERTNDEGEAAKAQAAAELLAVLRRLTQHIRQAVAPTRARQVKQLKVTRRRSAFAQVVHKRALRQNTKQRVLIAG